MSDLVAPRSGAQRSRTEMVQALLNPKNVVIVGATDKPGNWAQRVWRNLKRYGYKGGVFPFNPGRDTVWDTKCYRSFAELPEPPDHLVVLIPARFVAAMLREASAAGARSATIFSAGFEEADGADAAERAKELKAAIEETGIAVSGPNCLGNISGSASMMTGTDDRPQIIGPGVVAIIGQSGGISMSMKRTLEERGILTEALITSGNETGLKTADYISYFAEHPGVRVIVSYLESVRGDPDAFLNACRKARDHGKPVVVVKLGASDAGRAAAMAHTGALAGSLEAFDAVAGLAGAIRVRTTDDVIEVVEYFVHCPVPKGNRIAAVTLSGGMRGLLLDAAEANGLRFQDLTPRTKQRLQSIMSVGSIVGNPVDAGFAALTNPNVLKQSVEAFLDDPDIDIVIVQEEIPRAPGAERKEDNMRTVNGLAEKAVKPLIFTTMISHGYTDYSRNFRNEVRSLAFLQECDKTLRAVSAITRYAKSKDNVSPPHLAATSEQKAALERALQSTKEAALDELKSKELVSAFSITSPNEALATTIGEAHDIAARIGYPVVAKAVSAELLHKSEANAVIVGIDTPEALVQAFEAISKGVAGAPGRPKLDGILIAEMVCGGLELVIGASLDPEMGPVIMFGSGGTTVELTRDVTLAGAPLDEVGAIDMIDRTIAGRLIDGYRGRPKLDKQAAVDALIGLSTLMTNAGGHIQSIDINPFLLKEQGGMALDALVVLKKSF